MKIALDYDGTFTADPKFWIDFIIRAMSSGHEVHVVTMRFPSECTAEHGFLDFNDYFGAMGLRVIPTSRKAKKSHCLALGEKFDIWIDDHPEALLLDADQAWPNAPTRPEGQPLDPCNPS